MADVNAYSAGQYLGTIVDVSAHSLAPGQVVTARNLICGDTCKVKILQSAEYTDRFSTNRFPSPQWCVTVEPLTIWQRPAEQQKPKPIDVGAAQKHCTQHCLTTSGRRSAGIRLNSGSDIPSPFQKG